MVECSTVRERGSLGGVARAVSLPSQVRSDIATKAAKARWSPMDRQEVKERFWNKIKKCKGGCWVWTGARYTAGYGEAYDGKECLGAHQLSYILTTGPIPDGFYVTHTCTVKLCVNPEHLALVQDAVEELKSIVRSSLTAGRQDCINWTRAKNPRGYGSVNRNGTTTYVHSIAWEIANGKRVPDGLFVLHTCDNPSCLNPLHLFLGTASDNMQDMLKKRRHGWWVHPNSIPRGEKHGQAKLIASDVIKIRQLYENGVGSYRTLANRFGVSRTLIEVVVKRKAWRHI